MQSSSLRGAGARTAFGGKQQRRNAQRAVKVSAAAQDPLLLRVARGEGASRWFKMAEMRDAHSVPDADCGLHAA